MSSLEEKLETIQWFLDNAPEVLSAEVGKRYLILTEIKQDLRWLEIYERNNEENKNKHA